MDGFSELTARGGPLLLLAMVIVGGVTFGLAARRVGLPSITGQILAGVILGPSVFALFSHEDLSKLSPLTDFALGLIAATIGAHLNIARLRNAVRRLAILVVAESTITPLIVFGVVYWIGGADLRLSFLLAAVAIATAPATIISLVRETRSKGIFVKTLVAAVALNNTACIILFEITRALIGGAGPGADAAGVVSGPILQLVVPVLIGALVAVALESIARAARRPDPLATAAVIALVLTSGLATALGVSPLLACLTLGIVQTNVTHSRGHLVDSPFANFEAVILTTFFTLAGLHLSFEHLGLAGVLAVVYFLARFGAKVLAAGLAMRIAKATVRVRDNLGLALLPQAGVAVGLVILIQDDARFGDIAGLFAAVVLTVVTVNEVIGPVLTRIALRRAGEIGRDRLRLIDFLQEEHIVTNFHATSKEASIEKLVDLLISTHDMPGVDRDTLLESVLERERQGSTCLGGGLSVPHCILPEGHSMVGVMALSRRGLALPTPDGRPIHCMVLLGTAPEERERHLQVLATLARTVGIDPVFQEELFAAGSPAHAYELLNGEESESFNYFLEDEATT